MVTGGALAVGVAIVTIIAAVTTTAIGGATTTTVIGGVTATTAIGGTTTTIVDMAIATTETTTTAIGMAIATIGGGRRPARDLQCHPQRRLRPRQRKMRRPRGGSA